MLVGILPLQGLTNFALVAGFNCNKCLMSTFQICQCDNDYLAGAVMLSKLNVM